jgi:hypothetical protein
MNAEQYLTEALGGNMNISTLKPLAWHEIMEGYARHKLAEANLQVHNKPSAPCKHVNSRSISDSADVCNDCGEIIIN